MRFFVRKAISCLLAVVMLLGVLPAASAADDLFSLAGANMTLGNELVLNFMVDVNDIDASKSYTAVVTHAGETAELPIEKYNADYYCVRYGVAAKEMADRVEVYIVDETGDAVSQVYSRSVKDYADAMLAEGAEGNARMAKLAVDMLNYGAEAQKYFHYNENVYANADLTEEQQAMGGTDKDSTNALVAGQNFMGANLSLEEQILLNLGHFKVSVAKGLVTYDGLIYLIETFINGDF